MYVHSTVVSTSHHQLPTDYRRSLRPSQDSPLSRLLERPICNAWRPVLGPQLGLWPPWDPRHKIALAPQKHRLDSRRGVSGSLGQGLATGVRIVTLDALGLPSALPLQGSERSTN